MVQADQRANKARTSVSATSANFEFVNMAASWFRRWRSVAQNAAAISVRARKADHLVSGSARDGNTDKTRCETSFERASHPAASSRSLTRLFRNFCVCFEGR